MASSPTWLAGLPDGRARLADGREVMVKRGPGTADEAAGLSALAGVEGAPPVPEVIHQSGDLLVTGWVPTGRRSAAHDEDLGAGLARLHAGAWAEWGGGSSWIGGCRVEPAACPSAAEFYGGRLSDLALRAGLASEVEPVIRRLDELVPPGPPALLHGDLWWENVIWGSDRRSWLIDPSVHGGHPEEDLAMLALFGAVPEELTGAYLEVRPLDHGWQDRCQFWQLYPLLVHTVLFGGGYRPRAVDAARRYR